jgi:hypothetical protein
MRHFVTDLLNGLSKPVRERFCSTFGISNAAIGASIAGDTWDGVPGNRSQSADNALVGTTTFAGCTAAFVAPVRAVRAYVWCKNYILGQNTGGLAGMTVWLQVATSIGAFGTGLMNPATGTSVIASYTIPRATNAFIMNGVTPEAAFDYKACRIVMQPTTSIADACSFDCNIDAT